MTTGKKQKKKILRGDFLEITYKEKVGEKLYYKILDVDPTFNKQYAQWIFNLFLKLEDEKDRALFEEDLYKTKEDLKLFYKHKNKLPLNKRDITSYDNLIDLYETIKPLTLDSGSFQSKNEILKEIKKDVEILLDNENWLVLIPKTKEASIIYGKGTRWCTASENYNYYENYTKDGPLYIIIDKKIKPTDKDYSRIYKHQFHFESEQFMNADDNRINYVEFLQKNEDLLRTFSKLRNGFGFIIKLIFGISIQDDEKEVFLSPGKILNLSMIKCSELPENLVIHGGLNMDKSEHIRTIKDITVLGDFHITNSNIEKFEGKLYVKGKLDVKNSPKFKSVPEGFFVGSSFDARDCDLRSLPAGNVKGMVYVSNCRNFETISENFIAEKNLYANFTKVPSYEKEEARIKFPNIRDTLYSSNDK